MKFRNIFAVVLTVISAGLWAVSGAGLIDIPGEVLGALIATWTMIATFYFRKKTDGE